MDASGDVGRAARPLQMDTPLFAGIAIGADHSLEVSQVMGTSRIFRLSVVAALVVGLALGILVLDEHPQWNLFAGTALVAAGIVTVNARHLLDGLRARRSAH